MMRANKNRLMKCYVDYNLSGLPGISIKFSGTIFTLINNLIYITKVVNLKRIELLTYSLEGCCSILLSYKSKLESSIKRRMRNTNITERTAYIMNSGLNCISNVNFSTLNRTRTYTSYDTCSLGKPVYHFQH